MAEPEHLSVADEAYGRGVADGVKMGTALMDEIRTAVREVVRAFNDGEKIGLRMQALEELVREG